MTGFSSAVSSDSVQNKETFLGQVITLTSFLNTLADEATMKDDYREVTTNNQTNSSCNCEDDKQKDAELSQELKIRKEKEERKQRIEVTVLYEKISSS